MKRLIVNADDFGYTRDVNDGIIEAHRNGIVTATTIMAVGTAFHHAVLLAKDHAATLDVGVHLTLIGAKAITRAGKALPATPQALAAAVVFRAFDIRRELDAQIERVFDAGLQPTHLDTHKHSHLLPPVAEAVGELSERYRIPWVRRPLPKPVLGALSLHRLKSHGCRMTDFFLGYDLTGQFGAEELERVIRSLPDGLSEFMCHPGKLSEELIHARTRLKESRQRELEALTSPAVKMAVQAAGVQLTGYRNA